MWATNSIGFKLESPNQRVTRGLREDPRVAATRMQKAKWFSFTLSGDPDLHGALDWLGTAYEATGKTSKTQRQK